MDVNSCLSKNCCWISEFFRYASAHPFLYGFLSALVLILLLILAFKILSFFFFRSRRIPFINVETKYGSMIIQTSAICDLVHSTARKFPEISLNGAELREYSGEICLNLRADAADIAVPLTEITERFQDQIQKDLLQVFGIDKIRKIHLKICAIPASLPEEK